MADDVCVVDISRCPTVMAALREWFSAGSSMPESGAVVVVYIPRAKRYVIATKHKEITDHWDVQDPSRQSVGWKLDIGGTFWMALDVPTAAVNEQEKK